MQTGGVRTGMPQVIRGEGRKLIRSGLVSTYTRTFPAKGWWASLLEPRIQYAKASDTTVRA